jgi:hypothetical protein
MPASAAKVLQFNSTGEASWGSTTASTIKLHGLTDASLKINSTVEVVPSVGWFGPGPIAQEQSNSGEGNMEMVATYEESPRIMNAFFTAIAASTITSGSPYNYPYTAPTASTQVVKTYTIEYGTTGAAYRAPGSVGKHFTIRGEAGGFWTMGVDTIAKQIVAATSGLSTASTGLSDRNVNPVRMADTTLYVDAFSTGTIGSTSIAASLISFELDVETNRHLKQFAGSINPSSWGDGKYEGSLRITAEFNSSVKAWVDELLGSTGAAVSRQIRIGATQDSSASVKTFNLDFAGIKSEGETLFSDRDGNMTVDLTFMGRYSTGLANWFACNIQNGSSSTT